MKTGDLVKQFGVSDQTIRRWIAEFGDYLSDSARKVGIKQSIFTADDFIVLATVNFLSNEGYAFKGIHEKLMDGYRVDDLSAATIGYDDGRVVPAAAVEQIIDASEVRVELEVLRAERDALRLRIEKLEERLETTERENKEYLRELAELRERLGRAEGELSYRRHLEERRPDDR